MAAVNEHFDESTVAHRQSFFHTLSEKDQRRYAALEALRLGHGGITYVAQLFGCCTKTISRGIDELDQLHADPAAGRIRRAGAGRKKVSPRSPK